MGKEEKIACKMPDKTTQPLERSFYCLFVLFVLKASIPRSEWIHCLFIDN